MSDGSESPRYAKVGGWNLMQWPPFDINKVKYFNYFVDAKIENLTELCKGFFQQPSGGKVEVVPLINQVIVSFADIEEAVVRNDPAAGSTPEKDLLLWYPVVLLEEGKVKDVLVFCPYVFVANAVAVTLGREMFGFPKAWCSFDSYPDGPESTASMVCNTYGLENGVLQPYKIMDLENTGSNGILAPLVDLAEIVEELLKVFKNLIGDNGLTIEQNAAAVAIFAESLLARNQDFIYLKQFPSMTDTRGACFQQILTTKSKLGAIKEFAMLPFNFTLSYWDDHFHDLKGAFGWDGNPLEVQMSMYVDFSFSLETGEVLWDSGAG